MQGIQCVGCKHYKLRRKCRAYDIIPMEIYDGSRSHEKPYDGDKGIRFEPIPPDNKKDRDKK